MARAAVLAPCGCSRSTRLNDGGKGCVDAASGGGARRSRPGSRPSQNWLKCSRTSGGGLISGRAAASEARAARSSARSARADFHTDCSGARRFALLVAGPREGGASFSQAWLNRACQSGFSLCVRTRMSACRLRSFSTARIQAGADAPISGGRESEAASEAGELACGDEDAASLGGEEGETGCSRQAEVDPLVSIKVGLNTSLRSMSPHARHWRVSCVKPAGNAASSHAVAVTIMSPPHPMQRITPLMHRDTHTHARDQEEAYV